VVGLWIGPAPSLSQRIRVACTVMFLPMCRFRTMRILTCITSGVNGKRIRSLSAMVCPGFNPRVLPSHFSRSVFLLFRDVADLGPPRCRRCSLTFAPPMFSTPTLHCKVSIFKAILTPGSAPE
jgi:hypothetical protein